MKSISFNGKKYFINKHDVIFTYGKEDILKGNKEIIFPDFETEIKILNEMKGGKA